MEAWAGVIIHRIVELLQERKHWVTTLADPATWKCVGRPTADCANEDVRDMLLDLKDATVWKEVARLIRRMMVWQVGDMAPHDFHRRHVPGHAYGHQHNATAGERRCRGDAGRQGRGRWRWFCCLGRSTDRVTDGISSCEERGT